MAEENRMGRYAFAVLSVKCFDKKDDIENIVSGYFEKNGSEGFV